MNTNDTFNRKSYLHQAIERYNQGDQLGLEIDFVWHRQGLKSAIQFLESIENALYQERYSEPAENYISYTEQEFLEKLPTFDPPPEWATDNPEIYERAVSYGLCG